MLLNEILLFLLFRIRILANTNNRKEEEEKRKGNRNLGRKETDDETKKIIRGSV